MKLPKIICNIITQIGFKVANKYKCKVFELGVSGKQIAELAMMVENNTINMSGAAIIFEEMVVDEVKDR